MQGKPRGRGRALGADHQITAVVAQRIPATAEHFFSQADLGLGLYALEGCNQVIDGVAAQYAVDADAKLHLPAVGRLAGKRGQLLSGFENLPAFLQHQAANCGQLRFAPAAVEERDAEVLFQLVDGVGDRGRHAVQLFGDGGKALAALDRVQGLQRIQSDKQGHCSVFLTIKLRSFRYFSPTHCIIVRTSNSLIDIS